MNHQTVLITGTSSGFGLLAAVEMAKSGHYVVATMRDPSRDERLRTCMQQAGVKDGQYEVLRLDVTDREEEIGAVVDDVLARIGRIDVLINNAGYGQGGLVEELPLDKLRAQFETNFFGLVAVTQAVLPSMRERRSGKIINISSVSGRTGFPALGAYVSSKFAVEGFSESLRFEMLPFGVHVVLVEPASFKTEIWDKALSDVEADSASPYNGMMQVISGQVRTIANTAGEPDEVVRLLSKIVATERPRLRYLVGKGTRSMVLAKTLLPSKWMEWLVLQRLKS